MTAAGISLSIPGPNVEVKQRVHTVDALRGFALVGMLLVHFQYYVHDDGLWSTRVNSIITFLAVDRFYPLFAILFGTGFTLQFTRWGGRPGFVRLYLRRLVALMGIAAILIALTGYHVLESYAFWGLGLLLVRRWSNRTILVLLLFSLFSAPLMELATWQWEKRHMSLDESNARARQQLKYWHDATATGDRLRNEGKWRELIRHRLTTNFGQFTRLRWYVPNDPFNMFLIGLLAVRFGVFQDPLRYRKWLIAIIVVGVFTGAMSLFIGDLINFQSFKIYRLGLAVRFLTYAIFDERVQGMAYASVLLLWMATRPAHLARLLASAGRLSLTNYIVQIAILETIVATDTPLIRLNRWGALLGVVLVFTLQILFSHWWMARYRFGPLEWLWRSTTFMRPEPLRRQNSAIERAG